VKWWLLLALVACSEGHDVVLIDCAALPQPTCSAATEGAMCAYANADGLRTRFCSCESSVFVCNDCDGGTPPIGQGCTAGDQCVAETIETGCVCACGTNGLWVCTPSRAGQTTCL
jgi:hypothetical protein